MLSCGFSNGCHLHIGASVAVLTGFLDTGSPLGLLSFLGLSFVANNCRLCLASVHAPVPGSSRSIHRAPGLTVSTCCTSACLFACRFNAVDPRCAMELDDIKPESWRKLLAATSEYCSQPHIAQQFDQLAHLLTAGQTPDSRGQLPHTARLPRQPRSSSVQHHRQDVHIQRTQQQLADHPQQHATFAFNSQASHLSQGPRIKSASPLGTALDSTEHHSSDQWQQDAAEQAGPAFHKQRDLSDHRSDGISINEPLAAPKLMYNRGVLLVEAPRNIAASAVAAAAAAGSATVTLLRQHQQQELVGRLLAATLPQQLLHTCDVSALTASHTGDHQQQHQHVRQDSRIASAAAGCTSPRLAQLSQQQHQLPPPAAGISVNPRVSGGTPSVSPKSSSWLDWLPWQGAANSSEPQAEVAADVVTSPASPMGGGAQPTGNKTKQSTAL